MSTKDSSVTVDSKDLPKIAKKSKELAEAINTEKQIEIDALALSRRATISKIKVDKKFHAMTVSYSGSNKKGGKETTYTGYEEMLDKDYDLVQSLKYPVMEILEFPEDWEDDIVVTGISLNYDTENDALRGMVITMQKDIENLNCPLNINTPFIKFSGYVADYSPFPVEESCWDYETCERINEIIGNTYKYICGNTKTVQQKLVA